jgi:histidinol phosphatase-like enzyme (inositol monophosphatase family)
MAYEQELALAKSLAQEAGRTALEFQRQGVRTEEKADESPVTAADRACEKLIVEGIAKAFPEDGTLGEEGANRSGSSGRKWIIDPIDGTKDFVRGIPLWAILIGLEDRGEVVAGVAYSPGQDLLLWASKGDGAWSRNGRLHVTDQPDPSRAILSFNGFNKAGVNHFAPKLLGWVSQFWAVRGLGGAVDAMLLATGRADVWIEPNAYPWDLAPLKILVEEAGGCFGAFDGSNSIYGGNAWACVPGLRKYVGELLAP